MLSGVSPDGEGKRGTGGGLRRGGDVHDDGERGGGSGDDGEEEAGDGDGLGAGLHVADAEATAADAAAGHPALLLSPSLCDDVTSA